MSYIGNTATQQAFTPAVDFFNGNGSTTAFTLSRPVASVAQVQAVISNVPQKPGDAFTVNGNTITFTSAPPSGTQNIYVYYTSPITQVIAPGQGTVGTAQIQEGAVITADIANNAVTTAKLSSTTGTGAVALASLPSFTTTIGVGGAAASASGSGVSFPATQSASSDANTLDDYEEGTFTPTLTASTPPTGVTYGGQIGRYTKIGRAVSIEISLTLSSTGTGGSGFAAIAGLPFATANISGNFPNFGIAIAPVTSPLSGQLSGQVNANDTNVYIVFNTNTTGALSAASYASIGIANIRMAFTYFV
jgi:hypothetical protein